MLIRQNRCSFSCLVESKNIHLTTLPILLYDSPRNPFSSLPPLRKLAYRRVIIFLTDGRPTIVKELTEQKYNTMMSSTGAKVSTKCQYTPPTSLSSRSTDGKFCF